MDQLTIRRVFIALIATALFIPETGARGDELPRRGLMGVQLAPVTPDNQESLGLSAPEGILVSGVMPGTAAEVAGVKANDVIIKVSDVKITDIPSGIVALRNYYGGDTVKLTLMRDKKETAAEITLRPRDKESSSDYSIIYGSVGSKGQRARTITTRPQGDGPFPAILFMHSPGPMTIDFGVFAQHPYRPLVDQLTKAGIAVMRVEYLGVGDSEGADAKAYDLGDHTKAFAQAVDALRDYDFVDDDSVLVLGHGPGAALAPILAKRSKVDGIITFGAFARPWMEHSIETFRRRWALEMWEDDDVANASERMAKFMRTCFLGDESPSEWLEKDEKLRETLSPIMQGPDILGSMYWGTWRELARLDLAESWKRVNAPVLAVWGEADFISCRKCSEFITETVNKQHEGRAKFVALSGIDASFNKSEDQEESFLAGFGGTFNPVIVETIKDWIKERTRKSS